MQAHNEQDQDEAMSPEWKRQIELEYRQLMDDEDTIQNNMLHQSILETWKRDSPKMYARFKKAGMEEKVAFVMQQRMWAMMDQLMAAGYPVTDAREQAERETLMLEPEESEEEQEAENVLAELDQLLRESRQMLNEYRASKD